MDGQLPTSAATLEKNYETVRRGQEELEAKLTNAKAIKEKISKLKSSEGFLTPTELAQLENEASVQNTVIQNSAIAESKILVLEKQIAEIKSSGDFVSPAEKVQVANKVKDLQISIANAHLLKEDISKFEKDPGFCSESEMEKLQKELDSVQKILRKINPSNPGKNFFDASSKQDFKIIS